MTDQEKPSAMTSVGETAMAMIERGGVLRETSSATQRAVALQYPRDLAHIQEKAIEEAKLAGDSMYYSWEVVNQKTGEKSVVEGPSFWCAVAAYRLFGNCSLVPSPVQITDKEYVFTLTFVDHETGIDYPRSYRMDRNFPVYGNMDKFRKEDIRFQIGQSKGIRNVLTNILPRGLLDRMVTAARDSIRESLEKRIDKLGKGDFNKGREIVIDEMLRAFGAFGVIEERIVMRYGLKRDHWDLDILVRASGDLKALKTEADSAESLFPLEPTGPTPVETAGLRNGDAKTHQSHDDGTDEEKPADVRVALHESITKMAPNKVIPEDAAETLSKFLDLDIPKMSVDALTKWKAYLEGLADRPGSEATDDGETDPTLFPPGDDSSGSEGSDLVPPADDPEKVVAIGDDGKIEKVEPPPAPAKELTPLEKLKVEVEARKVPAGMAKTVLAYLDGGEHDDDVTKAYLASVTSFKTKDEFDR